VRASDVIRNADAAAVRAAFRALTTANGGAGILHLPHADAWAISSARGGVTVIAWVVNADETGWARYAGDSAAHPFLHADAYTIRPTGCRIALVAWAINTDIAVWARQPGDPAAGSASLGVLAGLKSFAFRFACSLAGDGRICPSQEGQQHDAGRARLASVHSA
jgi:hypothetical protein